MPGCWRQCAPHSLFVLDKKRTGRARSKRKKRFGGSVRAERVPPAAGGGRLALPRSSFDETRCSWGIFGPGEGPDTPCFSFRWRSSGACWGGRPCAVPPGYRLRWHPQGPTPSSARLARPPFTTKQSASEYRRTDLSTTTPKFLPDQQSRRKTRATELSGASR